MNLQSPTSDVLIEASDIGRLRITARGAQVFSWQTADEQERLYMSPLAPNSTTPPVRGGIPICFPQFGLHGPLLKHGFARDMMWKVTSVRAAGATLELTDNVETRAIWPHKFLMTLHVDMTAHSLACELVVENRDATPWSFTGGLHPYLRVEDSRNASLIAQGRPPRLTTITTTLNEGLTVDDIGPRLDGGITLRTQDGELHVDQSADFVDTVIWNPADPSPADLPEEDRYRFVCVEPAAITVPPVVLPGEAWRGSMLLISRQG